MTPVWCNIWVCCPTNCPSSHRLQASGNAIELLGTYEDRSCVYIVMEECRGGDLETLLEVCTVCCRGS